MPVAISAVATEPGPAHEVAAAGIRVYFPEVDRLDPPELAILAPMLRVVA